MMPIPIPAERQRSFKDQLLEAYSATHNNAGGTKESSSVLHHQQQRSASGTPTSFGDLVQSPTGDSNHSWSFERIQSKNSHERQNKKKSRRMSTFLPWRKTKKGEQDKQGTIQGVFLPCLSQIMSVIFFLRLPTITAQAGSIGATVIILVCVLSTFVTSLSLSAIVTNGTILAGGPYYIISRTLGVEVGGSLGLLFYLGTTLGGSMYVLGAVEAFQTNLDYYGAPAEEAAKEAADDLVAYYEIDDDDAPEEYVDPSADLSAGWFGPSQIASLALMLTLTVVVSVGMKYVNVSAGFFLATVMISIACIMLGTSLFAATIWDGSLSSTDRVFFDNVWPNYSPDPKTNVTPTFFSLLALFYPSVTGIMAGTNRSAKLATPGKSIPVGTISAITVTSLLYLCQVWLLGSVVWHRTLMENKLVVACIAYPSRAIVKIGIITACIGAALQCLTGAPQLLAAIAMDDAIPFLRFIQPDSCDEGGIAQSDPTMAIWVTYVIASLATLVGNLDHITPIITMFFLLMYGGINLCCFLLGWVSAPGFRPTFKSFHKNVSLFGFVWCIGMAMVINWSIALCAIGLFSLNYIYIYKKQKEVELDTGRETIGTNWGDVGDSLRYKITTAVLLTVTGTENLHAKNWRPQLLTVVDTNDVGTPVSMELLALSAQLKKGRGLNMVVSIKRGSLMKPGSFEASQMCQNVLKRHMKEEGIDGFATVAVTHAGFCEAVLAAATHSGFGPISPNIVLLAWRKDWKEHLDKAQALMDTIQCLSNMKRAVVVFKAGATYPRCGDVVLKGIIDIYWVVEEGGLCLLLPYLISKHKIWHPAAKLRVFAVATDADEDLELLEKSVDEHLHGIRIDAQVRVIDLSRTTIAADMTRRRSDMGYQRMTISYALTQDTEHAPETGGSEDTEKSSKLVTQRPVMQGDIGDKKGQEAQMETAKQFNSAVRFHSHSTNLVVTNMPLVQSMNGSAEFFCAYIDALSFNVENMLLVRGSENEVVTTIA